MGTHPIFESDFDCLTDCYRVRLSRCMEEDVDKKRTRRSNNRSRGRGNHNNRNEENQHQEAKPFFNHGNRTSRGRGRGGARGGTVTEGSSRGRGGGRRNNHERHHEQALDRQQQPSPTMRFTLSNGEPIEVRQQQHQPPPQSRRGAPRRRRKQDQTNGETQQAATPPAEGQQQQSRQHNDQRQQQRSKQSNKKKTKNEEIDQLASSVSALITKRNKFLIDADQRVVLLDKLKKNKLECAICMEFVKHQHSIWSCKNCFNILHLKCAKDWAQSNMNKDSGQDGWRCPYCQHQEHQVPRRYFCFSERETEPQAGYGAIPHSCDQPCGRQRTCGHHCPSLCHPGPCPPCQASERRVCSCGATAAFVKCGVELRCVNICSKPLQCGLCQCQLQCHPSDQACSPCSERVKIECQCGAEEKDIACEFRNITWQCERPCEKQLDCGNHTCGLVCHLGACRPCQLTPELITTCHCGKERVLPDERTSCLDPVPSCGSYCDKQLPCGHNCTDTCHAGPCRSCPVEIQVRCRCGCDMVTVECGLYTLDPSIAECSRQCRRKMSCGRHTCPIVCCAERDNRSPDAHICAKVCNKKLDCSEHLCEQQCHRGPCRRCPNVSFDELHCHCGAAVIYPPVYCGTKPPECTEKCLRRHGCEHEVLHNCHADTNCPPCPILMEKKCNCGSTTRKAIPCFQANVSCGHVCNLPLSCGHQCDRTCHVGSCEADGFECAQKCEKPRTSCSHGCGKKCHGETPCEPFEPCRVVLTLSCHCKRRASRVSCAKYIQAVQHQRRHAKRTGGEFDDQQQLVIECDAECAIQERNRKIAARANEQARACICPRAL